MTDKLRRDLAVKIQTSDTPIILEQLEKTPKYVLEQSGVSGFPILHTAVLARRKPIIIVSILGKGIDKNQKDFMGNTALMYAAGDGNDQLIRHLITNENVNDSNPFGDSPLHRAASSMNFNAINQIVMNNGNKNANNIMFQLPLHSFLIEWYENNKQFESSSSSLSVKDAISIALYLTPDYNNNDDNEVLFKPTLELNNNSRILQNNGSNILDYAYAFDTVNNLNNKPNSLFNSIINKYYANKKSRVKLNKYLRERKNRYAIIIE